MNALGRKPSESGEASPMQDEDPLVTMATGPPSEGMASQGSNPDDGRPSSPSKQLPDDGQASLPKQHPDASQ